MRIPGEVVAARVGSGAVAVSRFGLWAMKSVGEDVAARVVNNERVARGIRIIRSDIAAERLLQEVEVDPAGYRDNPGEITRRLVDIYTQRDPDAPIDKHAVTAVCSLMDRHMFTANAGIVREIVAEQTDVNFQNLAEGPNLSE